MPLTRISLGTAWRPAEFAQLSALFHECLVAEFDVPSADRFQFIERAADEHFNIRRIISGCFQFINSIDTPFTGMA